MFGELKKMFFSKGADPAPDAARERLVSIAALLVEAAAADENYTSDERKIIVRLLVDEFGVNAKAVGEILGDAEARQKEAVDLYRFIREAKNLSADEKIILVESLWRVILSDGEKDSFEDMLVRRVCGLIHVSDVESGLARQRVQAALSA